MSEKVLGLHCAECKMPVRLDARNSRVGSRCVVFCGCHATWPHNTENAAVESYKIWQRRIAELKREAIKVH